MFANAEGCLDIGDFKEGHRSPGQRLYLDKHERTSVSQGVLQVPRRWGSRPQLLRSQWLLVPETLLVVYLPLNKIILKNSNSQRKAILVLFPMILATV